LVRDHTDPETRTPQITHRHGGIEEEDDLIDVVYVFLGSDDQNAVPVEKGDSAIP
tara:strand:+ start:393 stop:557 length:165 start_codon:yes stop_codon:yes gene_type:complete